MAGCSAFSAKVVTSSRELDDVDLLAAQLADDRLHAHALHADACADRIDILVARLHGDLGALAGLARDRAHVDRAVVDLRHFALEEVLHQLRRGARDDHLRSLCGAVDAQQDDAHALAHAELLQPALLATRHARLGLAQVEDHVLQFEPLHRRGHHFARAVGVFIEDRVALGLAHLLEDHLLGHLRGDAAQHIGGLVVADLAAHFHIRRQLLCLFQRNLVQVVLDLVIGRRVTRLVDIGANLARLLVQLGTHVFLRLVVLARRQSDRILDRGHHDLRVDPLVPAQRFNYLVKQTRHLSLSFSCCNLIRLNLAPWRTVTRPFCLLRLLCLQLGNQLRLLDIRQLNLDQRIGGAAAFLAFPLAWMAERSSMILPSPTAVNLPCQWRLPATG